MHTIIMKLSDGEFHILTDKKGAGHIVENTVFPTDYSDENEESFDAFADTVESLALALACAGIDVTDPKVINAFNTTIDAGVNRYA